MRGELYLSRLAFRMTACVIRARNARTTCEGRREREDGGGDVEMMAGKGCLATVGGGWAAGRVVVNRSAKSWLGACAPGPRPQPVLSRTQGSEMVLYTSTIIRPMVGRIFGPPPVAPPRGLDVCVCVSALVWYILMRRVKCGRVGGWVGGWMGWVGRA